MRYAHVLLLTSTCAALVVGCGGQKGGEKTYKVTGTVTYQGKPVDGASVSFIPEKGRPAVGKTDGSGKFTLSTFNPGDGAIAGTHKVIIAPASAGGGESPPMPGMPGYEQWEKEQKKKLAALPPKYSDPNQSKLTAKVEPGGKNEFSFDLTD